MNTLGSPASQDANLKVLYIVGPARAGSTLLGMLLGEINEFLYVGELLTGWRHPLGEDWLICGCGKKIQACDFWIEVLAEGGRLAGGRLESLLENDRRCVGSRRFPIRRTRELLRIPDGGDTGNPELDECIAHLGRLLFAVAKTSGAKVIVDSSKTPGIAAALHLIPGVSPFFVNLLRDPRATVASWRYAKTVNKADVRREMPIFSARRAALLWTKFQLGADLVRKHDRMRSLSVRYEDLMARPRRHLEAITRLVGETEATLPLVDEKTARLGVHHTITGNPDRFVQGEVVLRPPTETRKNLSLIEAIVTRALTLPLALRHGYVPWMRGERGPSAPG
ncbi:MAG: sulfotransferase [Actinomycetota bacterium]